MCHGHFLRQLIFRCLGKSCRLCVEFSINNVECWRWKMMFNQLLASFISLEKLMIQSLNFDQLFLQMCHQVAKSRWNHVSNQFDSSLLPMICCVERRLLMIFHSCMLTSVNRAHGMCIWYWLGNDDWTNERVCPSIKPCWNDSAFKRSVTFEMALIAAWLR